MANLLDVELVKIEDDNEWKDIAAQAFKIVNNEEEYGDSFRTSNMNVDVKQVEEVAKVFEALCTSCNSLERANILNEFPNSWDCIEKFIVFSQPTDELQAFKPHMGPEVMAKILEAARNGKKLNPSELEQDDNVSEEELRGRDLMHNWGRLRRAVFGILRNVVRFTDSDDIKKCIATEHIGIIRAIGRILGDANEEGVNISYACTILRFLLPPTTSNDFAKWQIDICEEYLHDDVVPFIIGTAVTSRVVQLPDGQKLWVHMEATRLVASMIHLVDSEQLPKLLLSTRALCDGILLTRHSSVHLEMGHSLIRLIDECPNVDKSIFGRKEPGEKQRPVKLMVEFNERRMVEGSLGMLILSTKEFLENQSNDEAKQAVLVALKLLRHIAEDCADSILKHDAEQVLSTIGNVIPEALDVLAFIESFSTRPVNSFNQKDNSGENGWWCSLI